MRPKIRLVEHDHCHCKNRPQQYKSFPYNAVTQEKIGIYLISGHQLVCKISFQSYDKTDYPANGKFCFKLEIMYGILSRSNCFCN